MTIHEKLLGNPELRRTVEKMIRDAKVANDERRENGRYPYFVPVSIQLQDDPEQYSAFTRDISVTGMGLLHCMPVPPQTITVSAKQPDGGDTRIRVQIVWCVPCGEGWYISGGLFVEIDHDAPTG